jgi:bifunctional DNase/RNase
MKTYILFDSCRSNSRIAAHELMNMVIGQLSRRVSYAVIKHIFSDKCTFFITLKSFHHEPRICTSRVYATAKRKE